MEQPEKILQVHEEYVRAGADVLTTCSFGANRLRLGKGSLIDQIERINKQAVQLAKEVAGDRAWVAGDMGPTGEFFQPHGTLTKKEASEVFAEQAELLAGAGVDFFLLETFYDLDEASICLAACRKTAPHIPIAATITFNSTPRGFFTVMGDPAAEALQTLAEKGAFMVGSNCTLEARRMLELASHLTSKIKSPLLFQPNAGSPQITPDGIVYPQGAEEFSQYAEEMIKLGARAVGGCCGSDREHIRALRKMINSLT